MKVLVIGGGGREHALCWKVAQSPMVKKIFCAPGNGGISQIAQCIDLKDDQIEELASFARKEAIGLTVVGPEAPLVMGLVDYFTREGLCVFGPSKEAAQLEGSKVFAKNLMGKYGIPTAPFVISDDLGRAEKFLKSEASFPVVVKADGLAAGKGVTVARSLEEAMEASKAIFALGHRKVILEEFLVGEEASILAFCDGQRALPLASSQDHKSAYDDDQGPNTGGMGAYSPAPVVTPKAFEEIQEKILGEALRAMAEEGIEYRGILYAGLMITKDTPMVLEFNVRFGDPETQALLPRLKGDIVPLLLTCAQGSELKGLSLEWDERACLCVVMASGGYPGSYEKGKVIHGLKEAEQEEGITVFHAGTRKEAGQFLTSGGRVLGVTALGLSIAEAKERAYRAVGKISFEKMHYRKDIGAKALKRLFGGSAPKPPLGEPGFPQTP